MTELEALKLARNALGNIAGGIAGFYGTWPIQAKTALPFFDELIGIVEKIQTTAEKASVISELIDQAGFIVFAGDDLEGFQIRAEEQGWDITGFSAEQILDALRGASEGIGVSDLSTRWPRRFAVTTRTPPGAS